MKLLYTGVVGQECRWFLGVFGRPTPRDKATKSWRPEMVKTLRDGGFKGTAIIPEYRSVKSKEIAYKSRVEWEVHWLGHSNAILFWVPRNMKFFPALTTNIEFGEHMHSGKVVLGYPKDAEHMDYFKARAEMHDIPHSNDMQETADMIINKEKVFLYECERCYGSGQRDSNGTLYKCSVCDGTGFVEPKRKKIKSK